MSADDLEGEAPAPPRGRRRNTNTPRSRATQKAKDQAKSRERAWLRTLRAMDLLVVYGRDKAIDLMRLEVRNVRVAREAVDAAERYLDQHRSELGKGEARAIFVARMAFIFHDSLQAGDRRCARNAARDLALVQGVVLDEEHAPSTQVGPGLDVSALTDEERAELRVFLGRVHERRAREGQG